LLAHNPEIEARFNEARRTARHMRPSQYDVADKCNLTCEGCLYFAGHDHDGTREVTSLDQVDRFFANEAARGVNFAQLGGAEPALAPEKLQIIARHIPRGLIFTNGTITIDPSIRYRIHISIWGEGEAARVLRGADTIKKALKNYGNDNRAIFILTINNQNLDDIHRVAKLCHESGVKLSFSHFSPTEDYTRQSSSVDSPYFRLRAAGQSLGLSPHDLRRSREEIANAMASYPGTVIYSSMFNEWIHQPEGLYQLDEHGVATDCGSRVTARYRHFRVDLRDSGEVKCCAPNLDCGTCRIYAQSLATALHRFDRFAKSKADFLGWLEIYDFWRELFLLNDSQVTRTIHGHDIVEEALT
jgi:sulfatase maturation enzyme AslB (radical SAM superfamily)